MYDKKGAPFTVHIGESRAFKTQKVPVNIVCPRRITGEDWVQDHLPAKHKYATDAFELTVTGTVLTATRVDTPQRWGVDVKVRCTVATEEPVLHYVDRCNQCTSAAAGAGADEGMCKDVQRVDYAVANGGAGGREGTPLSVWGCDKINAASTQIWRNAQTKRVYVVEMATACPAGYTWLEGESDADGDAGGETAGVTSIGQCARLCNRNSNCESFQYSSREICARQNHMEPTISFVSKPMTTFCSRSRSQVFAAVGGGTYCIANRCDAAGARWSARTCPSSRPVRLCWNRDDMFACCGATQTTVAPQGSVWLCCYVGLPLRVVVFACVLVYLHFFV